MDYEEAQQQSPSWWIKDHQSIHHCQSISVLEVEMFYIEPELPKTI